MSTDRGTAIQVDDDQCMVEDDDDRRLPMNEVRPPNSTNCVCTTRAIDDSEGNFDVLARATVDKPERKASGVANRSSLATLQTCVD